VQSAALSLQKLRHGRSGGQLIAADAKGARFKLIATDGVFSMDGFIAPLKSICDLADKYGALVMVDDSHAVGFMGKTGRGTHEHCDVMDRIDILTGTLGKALGGASGGYTSGRKEIIELLRQRSRPYLFSNTLAPTIAGASIAALNLLRQSTKLRDTLEANTRFFRAEMTARRLQHRARRASHRARDARRCGAGLEIRRRDA
jgi:glycine C-acetyltransferase